MNNFKNILSFVFVVPVVLFVLGIATFIASAVVVNMENSIEALCVSAAFGAGLAFLACIGLLYHERVTAWIWSSSPNSNLFTRLVQYVAIGCGWTTLCGLIGYFTWLGLLFTWFNPVMVASVSIVFVVVTYIRLSYPALVEKFQNFGKEKDLPVFDQNNPEPTA